MSAEPARILKAKFAPSDRTTKARMRRVIRIKEQLKLLYAEQDGLLEAIPPGSSVVFRGKTYRMVDKFKDKSKVFKSTPFTRFDVEETK